MANSSVLIALSAIDRLDLLHRRFEEGIMIPQALWREVVTSGRDKPGAAAVASTGWIRPVRCDDEKLVALLRKELDEGEAEALALCRENQINIVLLDEKPARRVARRLGITAIGTVGMLIWATKAGLINSLRDELESLRLRGRFHLSEAVYIHALRTVGEE